MNTRKRIGTRTLILGLVATSFFSLSGCSFGASQQSGSSIQTTHKQIAQKLHYNLKIARIQFAGNGTILYTTHGTMQTEYANPGIHPGSPKMFTVLLRSISPWKYKTNVRIPVHGSPIADAMKLVPKGADLLLVIFLKPHVHSFETMVGGGDMIQFSFK